MASVCRGGRPKTRRSGVVAPVAIPYDGAIGAYAAPSSGKPQMTIRRFSALLCGAALVLVVQTDFAQAQKTPPKPDITSLNSSRSNLYRTGAGAGKGNAAKATTVKSSKSNTSDRMGGGGGKGTAAKATTVKSSKSNTSDRMGGGGGGGQGAPGVTR